VVDAYLEDARRPVSVTHQMAVVYLEIVLPLIDLPPLMVRKAGFVIYQNELPKPGDWLPRLLRGPGGEMPGGNAIGGAAPGGTVAGAWG
jgi:hypothetical protein